MEKLSFSSTAKQMFCLYKNTTISYKSVGVILRIKIIFLKKSFQCNAFQLFKSKKHFSLIQCLGGVELDILSGIEWFSIVACHAADPGSNPGQGAFFSLFSFIFILLTMMLMDYAKVVKMTPGEFLLSQQENNSDSNLRVRYSLNQETSVYTRDKIFYELDRLGGESDKEYSYRCKAFGQHRTLADLERILGESLNSFDVIEIPVNLFSLPTNFLSPRLYLWKISLQ